MTIYGSDHSKWDWMTGDGAYKPINYAASKSVYVFLKACDGATDTPHYFDEILSARAAGKFAAPYVWLYPSATIDVKRQAEFWHSRLKDEPLIVIDFESYASYLPKAPDLYGAIEHMRALGYAGRIMIYTGHYYWTANGNADSYWLQFPVWLARYYSEPPQPTPPWNDYDIWQFSASGNPADYGITNGKAAVDENRFEGTLDELAALFGGTTPPPPQETDMILYVAKQNLNIRAAPSTNAQIIGLAKIGNLYTVTDISNNWGRLTQLSDNGAFVSLPAECWITTKPEYARKEPFAFSTGGEVYPVVNFQITDAGGKYPPLAATWTPS